ncbi:glycosyltransferase [Roseomonas sp. HJA6]|uniref:Glycosyltransferase n=1 Tax=Roseomonas alba TaxID=2846776 RepID=A0ABS7A8X9_9PROT|nr:glycosyltransferase [Neoroseomonas alba]MBW6398618.1 glycosyltransferase [Neoroseomonas alba]
MARTVVHLSTGAAGGAGRAGRRAHLAARSAGLLSAFTFAEGEASAPDDVVLQPTAAEDPAEAALAAVLRDRVQWGVLQTARSDATNTLLSMAHPGLALDRQALIAAADILHLHWTSWSMPPALLRRWLASGRAVVWTLHDLWPMTGGCHYPAGCEQYRSACLTCPQLHDAWSLVPNAFTEKRAAWSAPGPVVVAPSRWMAARAAESAILGGCRIAVIPNPIETEAFAPRADRAALRAAFGIGPDDLLLVLGAFDNRERRKGGAILIEALRRLHEDGRLAAALAPGARLALAGFGRSPLPGWEGLTTLAFGEVSDDAVLADILGAADLACIPSLEDNYPNITLEALACGTPCLVTPVGGLPEMVREGTSGLVAPAAEAEALAATLLRFVAQHHGDVGLRASARAQVEAENALPVIGAQLAALYEDIAPPQHLTAPDVATHARALHAFGRAPVPVSARPGAAFLRFPANLLLRREGGEAVAGLTVPPPEPAAPGTRRLLALHTRHIHHGARSGPYQFLRHLPAGIDAEIRATPLGAALAGERAEDYRAWGRLLGAQAFGQQGNAWLAEAELLAACAATPADIIHAVDGELSLWLLPRLPGWLFAGGKRPAMAATFHQPAAVLGRMLNASLLGALDAVILLCEAQRPAFADHVDPARIHVVPHGIDTDFFTPGPRAPGDGFRLLSVGHWLRDHASAFAALTLLRQAGLDARLRLITPNPPPDTPPGVIVEAGLTDEALRQAFRDTDALLLPLHDATANNAILEALACGRPVVSTDVGGVAEMTGDTARLVPRGDARGLADAVLGLAADPTVAAALGRAARARAEALDWRRVGALHAAVYAGLGS